jgi:ABC-type branched-subunit amino acid transport system substrate-binding protein
MSLNRRSILKAAAAIAAPTVWSSRSLAAGVSDTEIVLGTHLDLSGPVAVAMPFIRNGIQMRLDEANEAGGIHGRKLRLVIEDNASQPPQAVRAVDKLLRRDEVFAMLCPFGSGPCVATAKKVADAGVLTFGPYAASALVRQAAGATPLLFTTNLNYDTTTSVAVRWAVENLGSRRVGIVYQEGAFGELVARGVKAALAARNLPLAAEASYKVGDIDLSSQVSRMQAAKADLIVAATTTRETIAVAAEVKKLGLAGVNVLTSSPGRAGFTVALGKQAVEGMYGCGTWGITLPRHATGELKSFYDSYRKRFGGEPDDISVAFYDYASWFVQELNRAGRDVTTDKLVKALQTSSFKGLASYDTQHFADNHIAPEWTRVEQVVQGVWVPRSPVLDPSRGVS